MEPKNKLTVIRKTSQVSHNVSDQTTAEFFYFLITEEAELTFDLDVTVGYESKCVINVATWLTQEQFAKITVRTKNTGDYGDTVINVYNILKDSASAEVLAESTVCVNTIQNRIDQKLNGILLSPTARMNGQPVLIMQSDDVVAKHSLKLGSVDEDEIFYLMSRKLSYDDARMLLIWSSLIRNFKTMQEEIMHEIGKTDENFSQRLQEKLSLIQE